MKIAIFGGSFDPIHLGHLFLAEEARIYFSLDKVVFVPAFVSPFKTHCGANADLRWKMVCDAISDNDYFDADDFEIKKSEKSYTIDTIRHFAEKLDEKPAFILGDDLLPSFYQWRECEEMSQIADLLVGQREKKEDLNADFFISGGKKFPCKFFPNAFFPMSSSEIRTRISCGKSWQYFVPKNVAETIEKNKLYR